MTFRRKQARLLGLKIGVMDKTRISAAFLNLGHALDHLMMLIFPTVILAMTAEFGRDYRSMLPLALGGFVAFGAGSLPAGWLGDRWGRRPMMILYFLGIRFGRGPDAPWPT